MLKTMAALLAAFVCFSTAWSVWEVSTWWLSVGLSALGLFILWQLVRDFRKWLQGGRGSRL